MKAVFRALALATVALLAFATTAHAQFTYTYYPNDTTINSDVTTDFAIVGYASGSYDDSFNPNFSSPSSPTLQISAIWTPRPNASRRRC